MRRILASATLFLCLRASASPNPVSLCISPSSLNLLEGQTQPLVVTATYPDNSISDVSAMATWASTDPLVGYVRATGLAHANQQGNASLSATFGGLTATLPLQVNSDALVPPDPLVPPVDYPIIDNLCRTPAFL